MHRYETGDDNRAIAISFRIERPLGARSTAPAKAMSAGLLRLMHLMSKIHAEIGSIDEPARRANVRDDGRVGRARSRLRETQPQPAGGVAPDPRARGRV